MKKKLFSAILLLFITINVNAQNTWTQKAPFAGAARQLATGFSIGNKVYIGIGSGGGSTLYQDFWEWDQLSNIWTQKADVPGLPRISCVSFSIGNKGYIGLGSGLGLPYNDFYEYDPSNDTWTTKANFPGLPRSNAASFSIDSFGYIGTGYTWDLINNLLDNSKDFWQYDPQNDTWTQKTDFPGSKREYATGFSIGSKGYIGIGFDPAAKNDFYEYDPSNDSWTTKANFGGTPRGQAVGFSINTKGYIGTGWEGVGGTRKNDFWEYDPANDTWISKANVGGPPRNIAVGFSIGEKGYIGTGLDDALNNHTDFWEYSILSVGIDEQNQKEEINIYPNPFSLSTTFQTDKIFKDATCTVYNSFGHQVKQIKNISGQSVTLFRDNLPSGLYFIRLTQDNKTFVADKLIITD